ncbi:signal peptidase I, partial [Nocardioides sp.]|uniref:signal peptidase I n=1 Tax=Nocardioides sp. TaxID=35761 RepID=UPI002ED87164
MEITTSPHRPAPTPWRRLVVLVVVLAPVSLLVLLPVGLGLERYVMSGDSMDSGASGGISQGSVVFERQVPLSDLRVGDVITFDPPPAVRDDGLVTHRIVGIEAGGFRTRGDNQAARDPWVLRPEQPTLPRVVLTLPWVGYVYLVVLHPVTKALLAVATAVLLVLVAGEIRGRRGGPAPSAAGESRPERSV